MAKENKIKKKEKEEKLVNQSFYAFNIKLLSGERKNENGYIELIKDLWRRKVNAPVRGGKYVVIRTQHKTLVENHTVLYGKISKFTKIDGDDWLNFDSMEIEKQNIPPNKHPNLKETDYYFIPNAHRFCLRKSTAFSVASAGDFLEKVLPMVLFQGEQIQVNLEQASDGFETILNAKAIKKLHIEISYTNDDISKNATKWMDQQLKQMNAGKIAMDISPDNTQNISIDNQVLKGAMGLAQSNGSVTATIVDTADVKKIVKTDDYPRTFSISFLGGVENLPSAIFKKITEIFKRK